MPLRLFNSYCLSPRFLLAPICGLLLAPAIPSARAQAGAQNAATAKTQPAVGTIKSISGSSLTLTTDSGPELKVQLPTNVKVLRVPPGSVSLKEATAIQLSDLKPGDRILVKGKPGEDAASFVASTVVAMKKEDLAEKQAREREEWQRHGIGGLVKSLDVAQTTIAISTVTATGPKDVLIHAPTGTVLRRYAAGSIKFDEAKIAPLAEIHEGDQLRARGARNADGSEFTADEIVSGSFRNIAGTIVAVNASTGTFTVSDLSGKKPVELKVTADSQMRKLPQPMAQRIAMRLKSNGAESSGGNGTAGPPAPGQSAAPAAATGPGATGSASGGGMGGPQRSGGGDFQQMLSRLPVSPLGDFQKGDAVMIVATSGQGDGPSTVITLLGGVEPILQASPQGQVASSILTPWSLSQGGGGDAGTP
ncbi:MAG: hypothetical protein WBL63_18470 [Candidatus Acidiferrum sp.]